MSKLTSVPLIILLIASSYGQAIINAEPDRFDLEPQARGSNIDLQVQVRNDGDTVTNLIVSVVTFEQEQVNVSPEVLQLDVDESRFVNVSMHLPHNISGGRHDVRLTLTESALTDEEGIAAQTALRIPIIFHVPNLKVAGTRIVDASPGSPGEITAMVFNYNSNASRASVSVTVRDETGASVLVRSAEAGVIGPDEHEFIAVSIPTGGLAGGVYRVETRALSNNVESNMVVDRLLVGLKGAEVHQPTVEPLGDGRFRLHAEVKNIGTVPLEVEAFFRITGPGNDIREVQAQRFVLAPEEQHVATSIVSFQGEQQVVGLARWSEGQFESSMTEYVAHGETEVETDDGSDPKVLVYVGLAVGVGALAFVVGRVGRRRE